jgi:hypothetical protein
MGHQPVAGVLEIFVLGSIESTRIPLSWLVVRGSPHGKKSVLLTFGSGTADQPLYEMLPKTVTALGGTVSAASGSTRCLAGPGPASRWA